MGSANVTSYAQGSALGCIMTPLWGFRKRKECTGFRDYAPPHWINDMSKQIKQMQMDYLRKSFAGVRDMVVLTASAVDCQSDNHLRLALRKKKISMQMVKNSLTRKVFSDLGIKVGDVWQGPTIVAWGTESLADLCKEVDGFTKKNVKFKIKTAICEGLELPFPEALKMPTKAQALGQVLALIMGPASQIAAQIAGPAGQIAGQIKTISEKKPEEAAPAAEAAPAPTAG